MEREKIIEMTPNHFTRYGIKEELDRIIHDDASVEAMWARCAKKYADMTAISDLDKNYTYAQLDGDVARMRGVLKANGIKKGDFVGMLIPNSYAFVKTFLAIVTSGAVAVLLPHQLEEKAVYGLNAKFSCKALVYDNATAEKVRLASSLPITLINDEAEAEAVEPVQSNKNDPCAILFTGGTTGKSKGALLSHANVLRGTINGCYGYPNIYAQRYLLVLPLTHVFGLIRNTLTVLYTGSVLRICRNPKDMFREMGAFKPTFLILVPALAEMGINLSRQLKAGANLFGGELRYIISGASSVPPHLIKEYAEIGIALLAGYGLTESSNLVSGNVETLRKPDSVGLPYPGQSLKIVDGELWIKGDHVMMGYYGEDEANKLAFEDGWFKTGDLVRIDDEGYFYIVGRIKEIIVLDSGEKVSPAEVEAAFCTPDYMNDAMVYSERNEAGRQTLVLEVVVRPGFEVGKQSVIADMNKINATLPTYARVGKIIVRDEDFPRSPSMKKLRRGNQ